MSLFQEPLDPTGHTMDMKSSRPIHNFSYPSRAIKPVPLDLSAHTPRTPWSRLDDGTASETKEQPLVFEEGSLQQPDILAYLSLVERLGQVDVDERSSDKSDSVQPTLESDIDTKEPAQDGNEEAVLAMTPAIISTTRNPSQDTIMPRIARDNSNYNTSTAQEESTVSKGEQSPTSPSFLHRGLGSLRRKSSTYSHDGSARSSMDSYGTMRSSKRSSRDGKGGWLSQIKEWTAASEPSSQALKEHRCETFAKAGITPNDPRAKAKLNLPTTTLPPEAIKPAGKPLKPEDIMKRHNEEKKRNRWSTASSTLSQASRSSMSRFSSSSSLGPASSAKGDR